MVSAHLFEQTYRRAMTFSTAKKFDCSPHTDSFEVKRANQVSKAAPGFSSVVTDWLKTLEPEQRFK
jgi:hypothetical protein